MSLFKKKRPLGQRFIAVFDIASASIGGSFVRLDPGELPEIIFSIREDIPFQEKVQFNRFLDAMRRTLESVFVKMQKAGGGVAIEEAFCILSSPWYASQTRLIQYRRPEPFLVTRKGIQRLLEKEIELFKQTKLFSRSRIDNTTPTIIESKNIQIKLNGYPVTLPYNKEARMLEIALYLSVTPSNIYDGIKESITKFWRTNSVHFSSFSFTAFDTVRDIFAGTDNFLFMDISGEVTDISLSRQGVLLESISFPAGKHVLVRALMNAMNVPPAVAISEMSLYLEGKGTKNHGEKVQVALTEATNEWLVFFRDAMVQMGQEFPLPKTIFYTADEEVARWYRQAITEKMDSLGEERSFELKQLGSELLKNYVASSDEGNRDPFLEIETIFAKKLMSLIAA